MTENNKNEKKRYKQLTFWFQGFLIFFLFLFVVGFVLVMLFDTAEECIGALLGLTGDTEDTAKNRILSFIGIAMGGALVALQALASYRRAKAMEDAANAQAEASKAHAQANQYTERGQRQERLKNAIEHLGHDSVSVRLGGAYELFHLAEDNRELNQTILDILCAHIRKTTSKSEYRGKHEEIPSEEIKSLLTLLFVNNHRVFEGCYINLQGSWLNGANLEYARLTNANLSYAYFVNANLQRADMKAISLLCTKLLDARLSGSRMQVANLAYANMREVKLIETQMQAAYFFSTNMHNAVFMETQMGGINRGIGIPPDKDFESIIEEGINKEAELMGIDFGKDFGDKEGEIKVGQDMLTDGYADIYTGAYTEEEAEEWITEYNEATAVFTKRNYN